MPFYAYMAHDERNVREVNDAQGKLELGLCNLRSACIRVGGLEAGRS